MSQPVLRHARLFLSHAGEDNILALALHEWLRAEGWEDVFLDIHRDRGIAPGEKWEQSFRQAATLCHGVILLLSRSWIVSNYCQEEFNLAWELKKQLFGVIIDDVDFEDLPKKLIDTWQVVRLPSSVSHDGKVSFAPDPLARLRNGLIKGGLDPGFFDWPPPGDPDRSPYPGMRPLDPEDAGIFFGRDAIVIDALDQLRRLREGPAPRLFVVIGASGAGKSSFLRAGLFPRLRRDDRHFRPLTIVRPEEAAISGPAGFAAALEVACGTYDVDGRAEIRAALRDGKEAFLSLLRRLANTKDPALLPDEASEIAPTIVVSIDQGEELFRHGNNPEAKVFLALCREMLICTEPRVIVVFTIRSDNYENLQHAAAFSGIVHSPISLSPMLSAAYKDVIEGPAARLGAGRTLAIDPAFRDRLLDDIERGGRDVLPLLALTLDELYRKYGRASGKLTLSNYVEFGGISGAIERTVERALNAADGTIPGDRTMHLKLLREGFIPYLASVNPDTRTPIRRSARMSQIPAPAQPLIRLMVDQRLLSTDRIEVQEADQTCFEVKVEPSHEALLRNWQSLNNWLAEDAAILVVLDGVRRAAADWVRAERQQDQLTHLGGRLEEAEKAAQRSDLTGDFSLERGYLSNCRLRQKEIEDTAKRERERRTMQLAADRERIIGHLRESHFDQAERELKTVVEYLATPSYADMAGQRSEYETWHNRTRSLAVFYTESQRVYSLAGEENFAGASSSCQEALRALGAIDESGNFGADWRYRLPTNDLSPEQAGALHQEVYRQLLLCSAFHLVPAITQLIPKSDRPRRFDPMRLVGALPVFVFSTFVRAGGFGLLPGRMGKPAALAHLRKASDTLTEVHRIEEIWSGDLASSDFQTGSKNGEMRHSLTSHLVGRLVAILSEFAEGPANAPIDYKRLLDAPTLASTGAAPEPVNAADYFFIGLLNFFVSKRNDAFVPKILSLLHRQFPYLDSDAAYAEGLLRTAISLEPRHYWPHWVLGRALLSAKRYSAAELAFNSAIAVDKSYARGYEQRALAIGGQWENARNPALRRRSLADSDEAMRLAKGDPSIFWPRGELREMLGETEEALDAYARWLEYEENLAALIARVAGVDRLHALGHQLMYKGSSSTRKIPALAGGVLCWVYITRGDQRQALEVAQDALGIDPRQAHALLAKGIALGAVGRSKEAVEVLTQAVKHDATNYRAVLELAKAYEKIDAHDKALDAWHTLRDMDRKDATPRCPNWMLKEAEARVPLASGP
jgi:tetratricopeptide (TPR) repeat protein